MTSESRTYSRFYGARPASFSHASAAVGAAAEVMYMRGDLSMTLRRKNFQHSLAKSDHPSYIKIYAERHR